MHTSTGWTDFRPTRGRSPLAVGYEASSPVGVLDDLAAAAWVQEYDAAWLGQQWRRLEHYLAPDVEFLSRGDADVIVGRAAVLAHLRAMIDGTTVHEYNATDLRARVCPATSIVTYRWQLDSSVNGMRSTSNGRDLLALRLTGHGWQLAWRVQFRV